MKLGKALDKRLTETVSGPGRQTFFSIFGIRPARCPHYSCLEKFPGTFDYSAPLIFHLPGKDSWLLAPLIFHSRFSAPEASRGLKDGTRVGIKPAPFAPGRPKADIG